MPNHDYNDRIWLTNREWEATCNNMETLQRSVERLERELLIFKTKAAVVTALIGTTCSVVITVLIQVVSHFIK